MGRTLTYEVFYERPLPDKIKTEILVTQAMLNYHFTWTCESLSLELFDEPQSPAQHRQLSEFVYFSNPSDPRPRIGTGFTKVRGDDWNACIVIRFLQWVSTLLPEATVTVCDEGDYILAAFLLLRNGEVGLDGERMASHRKDLAERDNLEALSYLEECQRQADNGVFFNAVAAKDYADRPEVYALGLTEDVLANTPLHEVVKRLVMPWEMDWLMTGLLH